MTHLWEMETSWFVKPSSEYIHATFYYKSWNEFQECKPYKLWKPYILSSWSWKQFLNDDDAIKRMTKRKEKEGAVLECSKLLRPIPSEYDNPSFKYELKQESLEMLQIVFISPDRFSGMHRVEMLIDRSDEEKVREWLKNHMPSFWKL